MPEGPEVRLFAKILNEKLGGEYIKTFDIVSGRYENKLPDGFDLFAVPSKVLQVGVKGKFIYFELENGMYIWQTFGMTGYWMDKEVPHTRFIINDSLYYSDQRNFGTIKFNMSHKETIKKLKSLGHDLLNAPFDLQEHYAIMKRVREQKKTLAQILMDQSKFPGVGNYIKAEALYRAKLSPHRTGNSLSTDEARHLIMAIQGVLWESWHSKPGVLATYPECGATFEKVVYRRDKDPLGNDVVSEETKDRRTTWWVPEVQK